MHHNDIPLAWLIGPAEKTWLEDYHQVWRGNHRCELTGALAEADDKKDYAAMLGFEPTRFLHGLHCGGGYAGEFFCGLALGKTYALDARTHVNSTPVCAACHLKLCV